MPQLRAATDKVHLSLRYWAGTKPRRAYRVGSRTRDTARAMSEENVEIVRRAFAEFERGNFGDLEFYDPEVRVVWLDLVGAESETIGLQGMSDFMKKMFKTFE